MFENRVLRIFGPKRDEIIREWRILLNEELNIVRVIKLGRMRWLRHVECTGERRGV
jgi:hypothetical protein